MPKVTSAARTFPSGDVARRLEEADQMARGRAGRTLRAEEYAGARKQAVAERPTNGSPLEQCVAGHQPERPHDQLEEEREGTKEAEPCVCRRRRDASRERPPRKPE